MSEKLSRGGRLQITIIALVFFGPLLFATWMYMSGNLRPTATTNHGNLLQPVVNLRETLAAEAFSQLPEGRWRLIYVNLADCDADCEAALIRLRQVRLMLGSEIDRVRRVFLHGSILPDKVLLDNKHAGLTSISSTGLAEVLEDNRPPDVSAGGIYLVDPLDNVMMYFSPQVIPGDMVDDLKHLLELSRIG